MAFDYVYFLRFMGTIVGWGFVLMLGLVGTDLEDGDAEKYSYVAPRDCGAEPYTEPAAA